MDMQLFDPDGKNTYNGQSYLLSQCHAFPFKVGPEPYGSLVDPGLDALFIVRLQRE